MSNLLTFLTILYFLIGVGIYAFTDPRGVASKIESHLWVVPFDVINRYLFFFVAFLWPLWLVMLSRRNS